MCGPGGLLLVNDQRQHGPPQRVEYFSTNGGAGGQKVGQGDGPVWGGRVWKYVELQYPGGGLGSQRRRTGIPDGRGNEVV